jgi:hypothetical protein
MAAIEEDEQDQGAAMLPGVGPGHIQGTGAPKTVRSGENF